MRLKKNPEIQGMRSSQHTVAGLKRGESRWRGMQGALGNWERLPADRRETGTSALQPQGTEFYQQPEQARSEFIPQAPEVLLPSCSLISAFLSKQKILLSHAVPAFLTYRAVREEGDIVLTTGFVIICHNSNKKPNTFVIHWKGVWLDMSTVHHFIQGLRAHG